MCGRYTLKNDKQVKKIHGISIKRSYNISPGSTVDLLASDHMRLKWSYSPPWAKSHMNLINARYETIYEKPSFKDAKRCVFIVDGWYEWNRFFDYKKREELIKSSLLSTYGLEVERLGKIVVPTLTTIFLMILIFSTII